MFRALARFVYRYRWPVLALWGVLLVVGIIYTPRLAHTLSGSSFSIEELESVRAQRLLERELGMSAATLMVVFHSDTLVASDPAFAAQMEAQASALRALPFVTNVQTLSPVNPRLVSQDGHTAFAPIRMSGTVDEAMDRFPGIEAALVDGQVHAWPTGTAPVVYRLIELSENDLRRAESVSLPLALVALLLVFGAVVAAGLPVVMGGVAVSVTLALLYFLALRMDLSVFTMNLSSMLGLGLAIDYSLFVVSRFREELASRGRLESLEATLATAGRAVVFSGGTVFIGMAGLLLFRSPTMRSMGIGGTLVVLVSVLAALTLLPALLALLGPRVNSWPVLRRQTGGHTWQGIANRVMRHPWPIMIVVVIFLLTLGLPFFGVKLGTPGASSLPSGDPARLGYEALRRDFGEGELSPILLAVTTESPDASGDSPDKIAALGELEQRLKAHPQVARVDSVLDLAPPGIPPALVAQLLTTIQSGTSPELRQELASVFSPKVTLVRVIPRSSAFSDETKGLVRDIRQLSPQGGLQVLVTGLTADVMDSDRALFQDVRWLVLWIVGAMYVMLVLAFRSVVIPIKALAMNALSLGASYGALVFIFQQGHLSGLLGFTPEGFIESSTPVLLFAVLFGLSMDYEVFLLSRVKESYDASGDNTASVSHGLARTGALITGAAAVLILVSGSFGLADIVMIKSIGVGIALAILIDATIVRALLVPATMRLLGHLNWWAPGFLRGRGATFG
ncbi:MAG: MMPL family transporter [Chloroflexi bacterium]|nr:MMPL family transporter [Chloroflexota bacterium]